MLALSLAGSFSQGDGGKQARSPGSARSKPESRAVSAEPVCSCAPTMCILAHETAGAVGTRLSLRPLFGEGQRICKTSGETRREIANAYSLPTSSRRTPGPIRRGGICLKRWLTACLNNDRRWLWVPAFAGTTSHTGSAIEYFTWLNAKLDSIEAIPSSRVSLFFRNAS